MSIFIICLSRYPNMRLFLARFFRLPLGCWLGNLFFGATGCSFNSFEFFEALKGDVMFAAFFKLNRLETLFFNKLQDSSL